MTISDSGLYVAKSIDSVSVDHAPAESAGAGAAVASPAMQPVAASITAPARAIAGRVRRRMECVMGSP